MSTITDTFASLLTRADVLLGWGPGYDPLHCAPLFARTPEEASRIILDARAVQSLAPYLPSFLKEHPDERVAVLARPCQVRSITALAQEDLIDPGRLILVLFPCGGRLDINAVLKACPKAEIVETAKVDGGRLILGWAHEEASLPLEGVMNSGCARCTLREAADLPVPAGCEVVRLNLPPASPSSSAPPEDPLKKFLEMAPKERWEFWKKEMSRCIRCYACRDACPMCVCRDSCVASSRNPHWLTEKDSVSDKLLFQIIHALHLAGRCSGCGECARACPMGIPVGLLKMQMNAVMDELFEYQAGIDPAAAPPLLAFRETEKNIGEKG